MFVAIMIEAPLPTFQLVVASSLHQNVILNLSQRINICCTVGWPETNMVLDGSFGLKCINAIAEMPTSHSSAKQINKHDSCHQLDPNYGSPSW